MSRYNHTHLLQNLAHVVRLMRDGGYTIRSKNEDFDTEPCRLRLDIQLVHAVKGGGMSVALPGAMAAHYARLLGLAMEGLGAAGFLIQYENEYDPLLQVTVTLDGVKWSGSGLVMVDERALIV